MQGQKGYTLSELVVSLGVMAIVVLVASTLSSWAIYRYYSVRDRLLAEGVAYKGEVLFRNFYGQAVDVGFSSGVVPPDLAGQTGVIHHTNISMVPTGVSTANFNFDQISSSAEWTAVSLFYRESAVVPGAGLPTGMVSDLRRTAVFYRRPSQTTSGVIFFNSSSPSSSVTALSPGYGEAFIERISSFGISKTKSFHYDKTTSIEVSFTVRYHSFSGRGTVWCPQADIESGSHGCTATSNWRNLEKRFSVTLANNLLKSRGGSMVVSAVNAEERVMGGLYLFRILSPLGN